MPVLGAPVEVAAGVDAPAPDPDPLPAAGAALTPVLTPAPEADADAAAPPAVLDAAVLVLLYDVIMLNDDNIIILDLLYLVSKNSSTFTIADESQI